MTDLRQREPRIQDPGYLAWLRRQRCACGCGSHAPSDAAHIRSGSILHGKRHTGMAEKPDDRWALPLSRSCHLRQHAFGSERDWWCGHGIDPFKLAIAYYGEYEQHHQRPVKPRAERKTNPTIKPGPQDRPEYKWASKPKRKIASRPFGKQKRSFGGKRK